MDNPIVWLLAWFFLYIALRGEPYVIRRRYNDFRKEYSQFYPFTLFWTGIITFGIWWTLYGNV